MALVKMVNVSDRDFSDMAAGVPYIIKAGASEFVPEQAMWLWMGAPDLRDSPRDRARLDEYERLRTRFGTNSGLAGDDRGTWDEVKPPLQCFTQDGDRIMTVVDDPDGSLTPSSGAVLTNEQLSERLAEVLNLLAEKEKRDVAGSVVQPGHVNPTTPSASADGPVVSDPVNSPAAPEPSTSGTPPVDSPKTVKAGQRGNGGSAGRGSN